MTANTPNETVTLDELAHEYEAWLRLEGLELGSADEHLFASDLTDEQRQYLNGFVERWNAAQAREDARA